MLVSQTYAIESGAFVLHSTSVLTQKGIDRMGTGLGARSVRLVEGLRL